jgi:hypothetical protein
VSLSFLLLIGYSAPLVGLGLSAAAVPKALSHARFVTW